MSIVTFARTELERAGYFDADSDYGGMIGPAVLKMVEEFAEEGHSGFSAALASRLFTRLVAFKPLTPLTGADDEWTEVSDGMWQNKRCPTVFKRADGAAYNIDGCIFREPSGACFTSRDSRVPVTFPYVPKSEYVDRPASNEEGE